MDTPTAAARWFLQSPGKRNDCRKLNAEQVKSISMRYVAAQAEVRDMAVEFGVTKDAIRKAINRHTFKWVL